MEELSFVQRANAARLEEIREAHRAWDRRERAAAERREQEARATDAQHRERQQRQQEAETARQVAYGKTLRSLEAQVAQLNGGIATFTGNATNAMVSGDLEGAGHAQSIALGLESLRQRVEAELVRHKQVR